MKRRRSAKWSERFLLRPLCAPTAFRLNAAALTILLGLTLDVTSALHVYGLSHLMGQRLALVGGMALVGIATGWIILAANVGTDSRYLATISANAPRYPRLGARLLIGLLLLAWVSTARDVLVFLVPGGHVGLLVLFAGGAMAFGAALVLTPPTRWLLAGAVTLGSMTRLVCYAQVPLHPERSDMLPLAQNALANLLNGQSPYAIYEMPWELPLTYLPLTWLAYLPPYLAGLDIRLTNLGYELGIGATLLWCYRVGNRTDDTQQLHRPLADMPLLLWAWVFLLPTSLNWSLATTAPVQWAMLTLTLALLLARRTWVAAGALGLCAAATPLVTIIAPFVLLAWYCWHGWRTALRLTANAGLVAAGFILPFLLWSPESFLFGVWRWFNDNDLYPRMGWELGHTWAHMVGFSGVFWRRGLEAILKPLQMLLLAGLVVGYWRWQADQRTLAPLITAAFLLFMVFNPVLWPYLYYPALFSALLALTRCSWNYE